MNLKLSATSTIIGTVVGAGFLGIPFVIMQSGFPIGLVHFVVLGLIVMLTMLYMGEVALRTRGDHQLSGYAEKYLGKWGKRLMFVAFAFGLYAAIIAYLIAEGQSFSYLFFGSANYEVIFSLLFWVLLSSMSYFGMRSLKKFESIAVGLVLLLVVGISIFSWHKINFANLSSFNMSNAFVPFGVVLFSFLAFSVIPEIKKMLGNEQKLMKSSIIKAYLIAFLVYIIFTAVVIGVKGSSTPQLATLALGPIFIILGIITMFTSYLVLSVALADSYSSDYKKSKNISWLLTIIIPLLIFLILQLTKSANFTAILGIGGVISGGLTGILILLMAKKAKINGDRKPEYEMPYSSVLTWLIIAVYIIGAVIEVVNIIR